METFTWKIRLSAAAVSLFLLAAAGTAASAQSDPRTSYVGNNYDTSSASIPAKEIKAQWTAAMDSVSDDYAMGKGVVATGGGEGVYYSIRTTGGAQCADRSAGMEIRLRPSGSAALPERRAICGIEDGSGICNQCLERQKGVGFSSS
ncbi:hypothetical protein SAMN04487895_11283 [Paenibacillus sophorae]|uniref:Uncharacterized protein n=1 Tax=Paenibacillus sophorae TaxID=1333845 RepID=A0A1H8ST38_9BACL|nr:hypothetical protein SAMN04487895_11283 [Paenibacillus sophorae]